MTAYTCEQLFSASMIGFSGTITTCPGISEYAIYWNKAGQFVPVSGSMSPIPWFNASLGALNIIYAMRGLYVPTGIYEYWTSNSPTTPPPSGRSLSDITVTAVY